MTNKEILMKKSFRLDSLQCTFLFSLAGEPPFSTVFDQCFIGLL